jgi:hypothetical protein
MTYTIGYSCRQDYLERYYQSHISHLIRETTAKLLQVLTGFGLQIVR